MFIGVIQGDSRSLACSSYNPSFHIILQLNYQLALHSRGDMPQLAGSLAAARSPGAGTYATAGMNTGKGSLYP